MTMNNWNDEVLLKECNRCGESKPITMFAINTRKNPPQPMSPCRPCKMKYAREYYERTKEKQLANSRKYYAEHKAEMYEKAKLKRNPFKNKARAAVGNAVRAGKFEKKSCVDCGEVKVHFHHTNGYDRDNWFTGEWVCHTHHGLRHRKPPILIKTISDTRRVPRPPHIKQPPKTHCPSGHPYDEQNTRSYRGKRYCRACRAIWWLKRKERQVS